MRHSAKELIESFDKLPRMDISSCIPVKEIRGGCVQRTDGRYVRIMEINPINFHLRSPEDQNRATDAFYSWVNTAPKHFQINIKIEKSTPQKLMDNIKREVDATESLLVMQRGYDRMNMLEQSTNTGLVIKRYFLTCEYDQSLNEGRKEDTEGIINSLRWVERYTDERFQYMDCSVRKYQDPDAFTAETLYRFLNPGDDSVDPLAARIDRIESDKERFGIRNNSDIIPYIAPKTYSTINPDFLYIDGKFQTYLFIRDNGYPQYIYGGWVDALTADNKCVTNIAIHFKEEPAGPIIHSTERSMNLKRSSIRTTVGKIEKQEDLANEVDQTKYIHDALKREGQHLYWVNTIITITADSYSEMIKARKEVIKELRARLDVQAKSCGYHYEEAFKMSLPLCYTNPQIFEISKRNFVSESVAGMFPFTSFSLYSPVGVPIAINPQNLSIVSPDLFDTSIFANPNVLIFGASGAGKTYTELILGYSFRLIGVQCMYVLPVKGYEYQRATTAIGGSYIKLGPGMDTCINFLAIRPEKDADTSMMTGEVTRASYLSKKIAEVKTIFQLLMRDNMSVLEENLLDDALVRLYRKFGITDDNESIWEDKEYGIIKKMPIPSDLYNIMKDIPDLRVLTTCLTIFITGSCKNMDGQTNIDLDNKFIVFDVDSEIIDGKLHPVFLFIAFTFCYSRAKENRGERCMLFLDEVWKMMVHKLSANLVFECVKLIRGYGSGVCIATQDINDFMRIENDSINDSIINNCATKIILKMERKGLRLVEDQLELNENEKSYLQRVNVGMALMMAGSDHVPVFFRASTQEDELFTTNPKKLEAIRRREQEAQELYG